MYNSLTENRFKEILLIATLIGIIIFSGCTCLKERLKGFLAISTRELEQGRAEAIVKIVDYDFKDCYQKIERILADIGSYVYSKKSDLIAVYISQVDTTPAGIFFKEIDTNRTQLEIVSPAKDTKEYLAQEIFSALQK